MKFESHALHPGDLRRCRRSVWRSKVSGKTSGASGPSSWNDAPSEVRDLGDLGDLGDLDYCDSWEIEDLLKNLSFLFFFCFVFNVLLLLLLFQSLGCRLVTFRGSKSNGKRSLRNMPQSGENAVTGNYDKSPSLCIQVFDMFQNFMCLWHAI